MVAEQFIPRTNFVLVKITFKGKGIVIVKDPSTMKVVSREVIAVGEDVRKDLFPGVQVSIHEQPLQIIKMPFENVPDTEMYVLVGDNDIIGIVKPVTVAISSLN